MHFFIGPYKIDAPVLLAPMAGITDLPLRQAARKWGAALTYSEMLTAETRLWQSSKSQTRLPQAADPLPRPVQIAGYDPQMLADAAMACEQMGAGMIDINMGCPAKKVCKRAAGSALLQDEPLVEKILVKVVDSVSIPVTLKTRTGWSPELRNGLRIAEIAEQAGIQALSVHGRTRACKFTGHAEYDSIAEIAQRLTIPVIANGDICSAEQAGFVLDYTKAAAVMIGRGALGQPWIFRQIRNYLKSGETPRLPDFKQRLETIESHLVAIHHHYGEQQGVRIARKHMGWYLGQMPGDDFNSRNFNQLQSASEQKRFFERLRNLAQTPEQIAA